MSHFSFLISSQTYTAHRYHGRAMAAMAICHGFFKCHGGPYSRGVRPYSRGARSYIRGARSYSRGARSYSRGVQSYSCGVR